METLDKIELTRGVEHGKVREKFTRVEDMLAALCMTTSSVVTATECQATTDKTGRIVQEAFNPFSYAEVCEEDGPCNRF
jgi:hypothetical protein